MRTALSDDIKDRNYAESVNAEWEELRRHEAEIDSIMGVAVKHPVRIQRTRAKDFDMQLASRAVNGLECIYVGRPTKFGNPFTSQVIWAAAMQ